MEDIIKKYTNGEITVVWKPGVCIHSKKCFLGLPSVFNPREKPWINIEGAQTKQIIHQVNQCPSGALSYYENDIRNGKPMDITAETKMEALPNGPLLVYGNIVLKDAKGNEIKKSKVTAFCRCGQSANKPFCDGSHITAGFKD